MSHECPICHKASVKESTPFCSQRCKDIDLGKWFSESYAVPCVELDDADIEALEDLLADDDE
jgi:endogenous inhibitor of DNA gyrase (YacG/DUF329 family)